MDLFVFNSISCDFWKSQVMKSNFFLEISSHIKLPEFSVNALWSLLLRALSNRSGKVSSIFFKKNLLFQDYKQHRFLHQIAAGGPWLSRSSNQHVREKIDQKLISQSKNQQKTSVFLTSIRFFPSSTSDSISLLSFSAFSAVSLSEATNDRLRKLTFGFACWLTCSDIILLTKRCWTRNILENELTNPEFAAFSLSLRIKQIC